MITYDNLLIAWLAVVASPIGVTAADQWEFGEWGKPFSEGGFLYAFSNDWNPCDPDLYNSDSTNGTDRSQAYTPSGPQPFTLGGVEGLTVYRPAAGNPYILKGGSDLWANCELQDTEPPVTTTACIYYPYILCTEANSSGGGGGGGGGGGSSSTTTTHSSTHSHTTTSTSSTHSHTTTSTSSTHSHKTTSTSTSTHSRTTMSTSKHSSTTSASPPEGTQATYNDQKTDVKDANAASKDYDKDPNNKDLGKKVTAAIHTALSSAEKAQSLAATAAVTAAEAELVEALTNAAKLAAAAAAADAIYKSMIKAAAALEAVEQARRQMHSSTRSHSSPTPTTTDPSCLMKRVPLQQIASNTIRTESCGGNGKTTTTDYIITSLKYAANATPLPVVTTCPRAAEQACYHYSSVLRDHPTWSTLTCPQEAATTARDDRKLLKARATAVWKNEHSSGTKRKVTDPQNWTNKKYYPDLEDGQNCQRDEYPPIYLLNRQSPAYIHSGDDSSTGGQLVRYIPSSDNKAAGDLWKSVCFRPPLRKFKTPAALFDRIQKHGAIVNVVSPNPDKVIKHVTLDVDDRPEFSFGAWDHDPNPDPNDPDGLYKNPCWPKKITGPDDPGFALLSYDPWYKDANPPRKPAWKYNKPYDPPNNGIKFK
ncbi:hypothetical protein GGR51DRAFT_572584 [Nemania sp. FL0031]|nr:hypothetical protein GGR51DRAFT_572584 [Nemania sp. FL0031]